MPKQIPFVMSLLALLLGAGDTLAQPPDTLWTHTYGTIRQDQGFAIQQTLDGGYVFAGFTYTADPNNSLFNLVKTDANGNSLWSRTWDHSDWWDECYSVQQTSDSGYILAGATYSSVAENWDFWVVKTNANGDSLWSKTFGGNDNDVCSALDQTTDGGFVFAGTSFRYFWLIKTDADGDSLWTRTFNGAFLSHCNSVRQTSDGGYALAGYTMHADGNSDYWLVKTDANGDSLWSRTFGDGIRDDECLSVKQTSDGGYVLAGYTFIAPGNSDFWLVKTDANGDELWSRNYGGNSYDFCRSGLQTIDGGYIFAGQTTSFSAGPSDYWLIKTDANGDSLWSRRYGGSVFENCRSAQQTSDGGYILAGSTSSFGAGNVDFWLVKTAPDALPPPFRVTSPNGGEQWALFSTQNVTWVSDSVDGLIRIELNRNYPDGEWELLADNTPDDNQEQITVPGQLSSACRVRISVMGDTLSDISNGNFSIGTSAGILHLVRLAQNNIPVNFWYAGVLENADTLSETFRLKNFGSEAIMVLPPLEPASDEFSVTSSCDTFVLEPGLMSACDVTLFYHPQTGGLHRDTLRIWTNAGNGDDQNYIRVPLEAQLMLSADGGASLPKFITLHPVYPNPFNPVTTLELDLPRALPARLAVYDVLGREVRLLNEGLLSAGSHRIQFDAHDLATGPYLIRLDAGGVSRVQNVMLIK